MSYHEPPWEHILCPDCLERYCVCGYDCECRAGLCDPSECRECNPEAYEADCRQAQAQHDAEAE